MSFSANNQEIANNGISIPVDSLDILRRANDFIERTNEESYAMNLVSKINAVFQRIQDCFSYIQGNKKAVVRKSALVIGFSGAVLEIIMSGLEIYKVGAIAGGIGTLGLALYPILSSD